MGRYFRTSLIPSLPGSTIGCIIDLFHCCGKWPLCRSFFPNLEQRFKTKIPITPEFTSLVNGHGKTRAYLHRFQLADDHMCPCKEAQQTSDHIIFECNILEAQRDSIIKTIVCSGGSWPLPKEELRNKYIQTYATFIKSIDFQTL